MELPTGGASIAAHTAVSEMAARVLPRERQGVEYIVLIIIGFGFLDDELLARSQDFGDAPNRIGTRIGKRIGKMTAEKRPEKRLLSPDRLVDARGAKCPMPLLLARKALAEMDAGQLLCLLSTDPASRRDIPIFAEQCGHRLEEIGQNSAEIRYLLRKRQA